MSTEKPRKTITFDKQELENISLLSDELFEGNISECVRFLVNVGLEVVKCGVPTISDDGLLDELQKAIDGTIYESMSKILIGEFRKSLRKYELRFEKLKRVLSEVEL